MINFTLSLGLDPFDITAQSIDNKRNIIFDVKSIQPDIPVGFVEN